MTTALLALMAFLTSGLSAVVGMAGGITLLSFMTFFLPFQQIVPIHGVVQLVSNSTRAIVLRKNVMITIFLYFMGGSGIGTFVSTWLVWEVLSPSIPMLMISALIFYSVFRTSKLPPLKIPFWGFAILGLVAGFLGPIIGAVGPLLAPFFLRDDFTKEQIIATKASVQLVGHFFKLPAFMIVGFDYLDHINLIVIMSLMAILGTNVGVTILKKIKDKHFQIVFKSALFISALRLIWKAVF